MSRARELMVCVVGNFQGEAFSFVSVISFSSFSYYLLECYTHTFHDFPPPPPRPHAEHTLEVEENENHLRSVFVESRESLSECIIADLADYRHKRVMGLAGMFGDHMLTSERL